MRKNSIAFVALALAALAGCDDEDVVNPSDVTGTEWRLQSYQQPDFAVLSFDPGLYTLKLEADGTLSARSDCNRCTGGYTLSGSSLTVGPLACTRAFCGEASFDPEYGAVLQGAETLDEDEDRLEVRGGGSTLRYVR